LVAIDDVPGDRIIVVCGDIFHDRNVLDAYVVQLFARLMSGLVRRGKVVIIQGNHDHHPSHDDVSAPYDILGALLALFDMDKDVLYVRESGHHVVSGVGIGVVTVHDVSAEGDVRSNHLKATLPPFPPPDPDCSVNVALYHGMLASCRSGTGAHVEQHGVPLDWFVGYDAALLGDVHLQQVGNHVVDSGGVMRFDKGRTAWAYPGSLVQQDHGEQLWGHGLIVWDLGTRSIRPVHVRCPHGYLTVDGDGNVMYDMRWTPLSKHLADPDFPTAVCVRATGDADPSTAVEALVSKGVLVEAVAGARRPAPSSVDTPVTKEAIRGGGQGLLGASGLDVEAAIRAAALPPFENEQLNSLASDRASKLDKLLTRFRDVKGTTGVRLEIGLMRWSWILSFPADNATRVFGDAGVTVLHAPNGAGKTALLETLHIALYGEGFPSRSPKEDATSFLNDHKPADAVASTALEFRLGDRSYMVVRKWQKVNGKGVCKAVALKSTTDGGRVVDLHKGRLEVDKWIAANVCSQPDFLAGVLLSQGNDGDFLGMTFKEQSAIMDRAFGLDAIDALHDFLHEARNSMLYVLNQVPDVSASSTGGSPSVELATLRDAFALARRQDAEARAALEMLPPPCAPFSTDGLVAAERLLAEWGAEDVDTSLDKVSVRLATVSRIELPRKYPVVNTEYVGSFDDAKKEVDAAVRFERECARHKWSFKDLCDSEALDSQHAARPDLDGLRRAAADASRPVQRLQSALTGAEAEASRYRDEARLLQKEVDAAAQYKRTRDARALAAAATMGRPVWLTDTSNAARLTVLLKYLTTPGGALLPSTASLVQALGAREDRPVLLLPTLDACLEALGAPPPAVDARVRQPPPKYSESEANALLLDILCRQTDAERRGKSYADAREEACSVAAKATRALEEATLAEKRHETHRLRSEALSCMRALRRGITPQTGAAIAKFSGERSRLEAKVARLKEVKRARALLATAASEKRRAELKEAVESANLMEVTKMLGRAEAVEEWTKDEGAIAECRRRLGVVMYALATLTELKATTYADSVLPRLCDEVNALISAVDPSLGVHAAAMDGGGVRWFATVFGQNVRIRRASGFQRFMIALGIRIVLGQMIRPCGCVLIDEGFTACDGTHIARVPAFLKGMVMSGRVDTVLIVTHISTLQDGVDNSVSLIKGCRVDH
jgi:DNA repair exonuclease SbcCD ATPase subunit/DNA repair exonuclease SbcCD nuclease subunit